ncbi:MAG: sugar phosphate isomerase/epimerase [Rhizobiales bacterium]|nr:sugar phosphate isomerase/epimerase [Hyphomicrobiales bacterium]
MRLGIFAKTFPGNEPHIVLSAASLSGYAAVQYNMACSGIPSLPQRISGKDVAAVRRAAKEAGIEIAAVSATYNMIDPIDERRLAGRKSFAAIAVAAHEMGSKLVTVCTGSRDPADQWRHHPDNATQSSWDEMCREFDLLLPIAKSEDIVIGVEPELANVVSSAEKARKLLDTFRSRHIGIVLDAANLFETATLEKQNVIVSEAISVLGPSIVMAHAKDRTQDGGFTAAGHGVIDWRHYLSELQTHGFDGPLVTHGLEAQDAPEVATFLSGHISALEA